MKKKMFLVSALVAVAVSAMFIACGGKSISNGCTCTFSEDGETETYEYSPAELREIAKNSAEEGYVINTCGDLQKMHMDVLKHHGGLASVRCR